MSETETCGFIILELLRLFLDDYELPWTKSWTKMYRLIAIFNPLPTTWDVQELKEIAPRHFELLEKVDYFFKKQFPMFQMPLIEGDKVRVERLCIIGCHKVVTDSL